MKSRITHLVAALALACAGAHAAPTAEVGYGALWGTTVNFNSLAPGAFDSVVIDGLLSNGGVQFGERFAGQELAIAKVPRAGFAAQDWFDDLSFGGPTAGLTLLAGEAGANLGAYHYGDADGAALFGIGPQNSDGSDPTGSGAISARFATPVYALGLQLRDADAGAMLLNLYRLDGSLIEAVDLGGRNDGFYAFARTGGVADIAGFTLTNRDAYYGVSIDNLLLAPSAAMAAVPEPASLALLLTGLGAMGAAARRRPARR